MVTGLALHDPLAIGVEHIGPFGELRTNYPDKKEIDITIDPNTSSNYEIGGVSYSDYNSYTDLISKSVDFRMCLTNRLYERAIPNLDGAAKPCLTNQLFKSNENTGLKDIVLNFIDSDLINFKKKPILE